MGSLYKLVCTGTVTLLMLTSVAIATDTEKGVTSEKDTSGGLVTENELRAVIRIMEANKRNRDVLKILERERLSLARLQEIMTQIAMVKPYLEIRKASRSMTPETMTSAEDAKQLEEAKRVAENYGLKYFEDRGGRRAFEAVLGILTKHQSELEEKVLNQFQPTRQ